eukprot:gene2031-3025_t
MSWGKAPRFSDMKHREEGTVIDWDAHYGLGKSAGNRLKFSGSDRFSASPDLVRSPLSSVSSSAVNSRRSLGLHKRKSAKKIWEINDLVKEEQFDRQWLSRCISASRMRAGSWADAYHTDILREAEMLRSVDLHKFIMKTEYECRETMFREFGLGLDYYYPHLSLALQETSCRHGLECAQGDLIKDLYTSQWIDCIETSCYNISTSESEIRLHINAEQCTEWTCGASAFLGTAEALGRLEVLNAQAEVQENLKIQSTSMNAKHLQNLEIYSRSDTAHQEGAAWAGGVSAMLAALHGAALAALHSQACAEYGDMWKIHQKIIGHMVLGRLETQEGGLRTYLHAEEAAGRLRGCLTATEALQAAARRELYSAQALDFESVEEPLQSEATLLRATPGNPCQPTHAV